MLINNLFDIQITHHLPYGPTDMPQESELKITENNIILSDDYNTQLKLSSLHNADSQLIIHLKKEFWIYKDEINQALTSLSPKNMTVEEFGKYNLEFSYK